MPSGRDIRAGGAFVEFSVRRQRLERDLRAIAKRVTKFGASVAQIGARLSAIGATITAPFALAIRQFTKVGDQLDKMSKRTGFSVEALSELRFAAEQSGGNLELLEKGIRSMQRSINDLGRGLSTQKDAFTDLGLTFSDLDGLSPEDQFEKIADGVSRIEDPSKRAAVAMQVFGRAGQQLIPLLAGGSAAINELRAEAKSLGLTISTDTAASAAKLADLWNILKKQALVLAVNIGAQLAPVLQRITQIISGIGSSVIEWAKQNGGLIRTVAAVGAGVLALGGVLIGVGAAAAIAGVAISGLATVVGALLSPFGVIVTAMSVATVALLKFTTVGGQAVNFLKDRFGGLLGFIVETFGAISEAIAAGEITIAVEILWASIELVFIQGTSGIRDRLQRFKFDAIKAWVEIKAGILGLANELAAGIGSTFVSIASTAATAWQNIAGDARETWNLITLLATKAGAHIRGALDDSFDVEGYVKAADDVFVASQKQAQKSRTENLKAIESTAAAIQTAIEVARQARNDEIARSLDDSLKSLREIEDSESKALEEHIAKLEAQRQAAIDRLKGLIPSSGLDAPDFDPKLEGLESALNQLSKNVSTRGVTNSAAIQALQGPSTAKIDKLNNTAAKQLETLESIDGKMTTGGVIFI